MAECGRGARSVVTASSDRARCPAQSWPPAPDSGRVSRAIQGRPRSACSTAGSTRPSVTAGSTSTRPGGAVCDQPATPAHWSAAVAGSGLLLHGEEGPRDREQAQDGESGCHGALPGRGRHDHESGQPGQQVVDEWGPRQQRREPEPPEKDGPRRRHRVGGARGGGGIGNHDGHPPRGPPTTRYGGQDEQRCDDATVATQRSATADTATTAARGGPARTPGVVGVPSPTPRRARRLDRCGHEARHGGGVRRLPHVGATHHAHEAPPAPTTGRAGRVPPDGATSRPPSRCRLPARQRPTGRARTD